MSLTKTCISNPVPVLAMVLAAMLIGIMSLYYLPVQLIPQIHKPTITITTTWRAAAPDEVVSNLIEPQEDVLRGLPGMTLMESSATQGKAVVALRFATNIDSQTAMLEVINRLNQVSHSPADADEPMITQGDSHIFNPLAFLSLRRLPGNDNAIEQYQDFVEDVAQPFLEKVDGVSEVSVFGNLLRREIQVTFDPKKAASLELEIPDIIDKLITKNDVSAGFKDVGRRQYTLRFVSSYELDALEHMILDWRNGQPVFLRDIADIDMTTEDRTGVFSLDGHRAVAFAVSAGPAENAIEVNQRLQAAISELNAGVLKKASLELVQVYDQTVYINHAIHNVVGSLATGILLAVGMLWLFLRKAWATSLVAMSIPLSILVSFIALLAADRTLNIISLAGLAFAIGIVLDPAIVVLEGIIRNLEDGKKVESAAYHASSQVAGALLVSTITTVIIFLPVTFLDGVAGQLFKDLAVAISVAVVVSLLIAMTVLPTAANRFSRRHSSERSVEHWWRYVPDKIMAMTNTRLKQLLWVVALTVASVTGSVLMFPALDYLPKGNQNLFSSFIIPPPGLSIASAEEEILNVIDERLRPHILNERQPAIDHVWVGVNDGFGFMGGSAKQGDQIEALVGVINRDILTGFPDTIAFTQQAHLFQHLDGENTIDLNIQANDDKLILAAAQRAFTEVHNILPGANVQPLPSLEYAEPQLRMVPQERRMVESGWSRDQLANVAQALGTGYFVGEYFDGQKRVNTYLRVAHWNSPEELSDTPLYSESTGVIPFGELVSISRTAGPNEIRRVDGLRTITLRVRPAVDMSLHRAITLLEQRLSPTLSTILGDKGYVTYRGTAENFSVVVNDMLNSFWLAIVILFLMMAALFRSFSASLLVLFTIPLALVGSFACLKLTNVFVFQALDVLTMIGFVVMLGLTVNNAILLVHQTKLAEKQGLCRIDAVRQAIDYRVRPILMTTLTSVFGMLPLLLAPSAGAELYRGIAAVIIGGMFVSMVLTMIFLPSLLQLMTLRSNRAQCTD